MIFSLLSGLLKQLRKKKHRWDESPFRCGSVGGVAPRTKTIRSPASTRKKREVDVRGEHYNLQEIYDQVNAQYFQSQLDLQITWFGSLTRIARRSRLLGVYEGDKRLIKIHRLLDHPEFPPYFISYIVYHEMLHHLFPPHRVRRGKRKVHHAEFKAHEERFAEYSLAKEWEKKNRKVFFQRIGERYGRS